MDRLRVLLPARPGFHLYFHLQLCLLLALLLGGCAALPPGADYPRTASAAYTHPEQTGLGQRITSAEQAHAPLSGFRILTKGEDGFLTRMQLIAHAEQTIDVQYFIFHNDDTGKLLADALLQAADRGVRVRILVDDGETEQGDEQLFVLQAHPHIEIRVFNPFRYRGHSELMRAVEFAFNHDRLDYRMHNKLFVVDNALALAGGRNLADGYFQVDPALQFGDDDIFSEGPIVQQLSGTFDEFWNSANAIPAAALTHAAPAALQDFRQVLEQHRQHLTSAGADYAVRIASGQPLEAILSGAQPLTWAHAQVVCDSPDKAKIEKGEERGRLMNRKVAAEVSQVQNELLMVSPYLVPGDDGMKLLEDLRTRQVHVDILTNSLVSSIVASAQAGYMRYRPRLLEDGIELHEIKARLDSARGSGQSAAMNHYGNYSLHAKLFVLDRKKLYIGSMNFDQRSMHLNTEIGLIIDSEELAMQTATRFASITSPANSYQVTQTAASDTSPAHLQWHTEEDGAPVDYDSEPARSAWSRIQVGLIALLPIDREL